MSPPKPSLIIISAGAFGRELCATARGIRKALGDACPWDLRGFLDDRPDILLGKTPPGIPVLGSPAEHQPRPDERFICAIGDPRERERYASLIESRGGCFATLAWPGSLLATGEDQLGKGAFVGPFCALSCDVTLGAHTMIMAHVTVGHDVHIGRCSHLGAYAFVGGGARIGDRVSIHPHATILPGAEVGDDAVVGAGSVVLRSVRAGATVFGVPARPVET